jgi:Lon protease-like protein
MGHENLYIYAYISHPPVFLLSDAIVLPPYTATYLIYETAYRLMLQFAGEEAPPLVEALRSRANEELQTLMNKSATVQQPPAITVYRRRGVRQYE